MRWDCISPSPLPCPVMLWGRRRRGWTFFFMVWRFCSERELFNLLPCVAEQYRGETEETVVSEERGWKDRIKFWLYVLIPPSLRTSPYILQCKTQRGRLNFIKNLFGYFLTTLRKDWNVVVDKRFVAKIQSCPTNFLLNRNFWQSPRQPSRMY